MLSNGLPVLLLIKRTHKYLYSINATPANNASPPTTPPTTGPIGNFFSDLPSDTEGRPVPVELEVGKELVLDEGPGVMMLPGFGFGLGFGFGMGLGGGTPGGRVEQVDPNNVVV